MPDITIRPAAAADQPAITAIVRAARINPMGLDWRRFLVAEDNGRIVGTGQVKPHRGGSRELASIAVIPERQGQGIAAAIIAALIAQEPGPVYLMCRHTLQGFYERFGFRTIGPNEMPPSLRRFYRLGQAISLLSRPFVKERLVPTIMRRMPSDS